MYKIIGGDQKEYGPISADQLRQWIAANRVNAQTKVQEAGSPDWRSLAEFAEFAAALNGRVPPAPTPPGLGASAPQARTSRLAIASLVLGILGLFTCGVTALVGLILGIVSMVKINKSNGALGGRGLALAGTIVSAVFLLLIPVQAALLLPALARAKSKAQTVQCMNNMKQLALGLRMYADDNNDQLPQGANWCDAIQPYLGGGQPFKCFDGDPSQRAHYAFNANLAGMKLSKIQSPAQTVLVFEIKGGWNVSGGSELLPQKPRHAGAVGLAFADGHSEIAMPQRLQTMRWEP
jgi:prepilin-type processing-associated H-X9-DG protein